MNNVLPATLLLAAATLAWEVVVRVQQVPLYLVPLPSAVAMRWMREPGFFMTEGGVSLAEALAGLAVGGGLAFLAGVLMARLPWLEHGLLPLAIVLKMTPVVVLAPLFVLWFGFGAAPRVLIAALLTFFPVLIGVVAGLRSPPPAAREVLATLDANSNLDTPTTLAGVLTLAVIGVGLVGALALLERRLVFWQPAQ